MTEKEYEASPIKRCVCEWCDWIGDATAPDYAHPGCSESGIPIKKSDRDWIFWPPILSHEKFDMAKLEESVEQIDWRTPQEKRADTIARKKAEKAPERRKKRDPFSRRK